jgi:hypothetical protein
MKGASRHLRAALGAAWLGCASLTAGAHDLITAEAAERYLVRATADLERSRSRESPARRAEALYDLGRLVDELRELLNRDIATHGKVQGLPSNVLVKELRGRSVALDPAPDSGRFGSGAGYYRTAVELDPQVAGGDGQYRLLAAEFYDGFDGDPLATRWPHARIVDQVRLAERLRSRQPPHPEVEEIHFILVVTCVQAARTAPDRDRAKAWRERAAREAAAFRTRHPDSLRVAALEVLLPP